MIDVERVKRTTRKQICFECEQTSDNEALLSVVLRREGQVFPLVFHLVCLDQGGYN